MDLIEVGLITIGQSPRDDIIPEIKPLFSPKIEIIERGLLDNLSINQIQKLKPEKGEFTLVSRLKDGTEVQLSEQKINSLMSEVINSMKDKMGIKAVGILCTHDFPKQKFPIPVIFPFDFIKFLISQVLKTRKIGLVIPLESQINMTKEKWKNHKVSIISKSPYRKEKSWKEIAQFFKKKKVDVIILDCIGYTLKDKQKLQELVEIPLVSPRIIIPFAINQLF